MNTTMTHGIAAAFALGAATTLTAPAQAAVFEEDFESYTSPTSLQNNVAPGGWFDNGGQGANTAGNYNGNRQASARALNEVFPGDGSVTIPVSPFGGAGGNQVMEYYDDHRDRVFRPAVNIAPTPAQYPLTLTFDFRIDARWDPASASGTAIAGDGVLEDGTFRVLLQDSTSPNTSNGYFLNLVSSEATDDDPNTQFEMSYVDGGTDNFLVGLEQDAWYRVEMEIPEPNGTQQSATITVQEWQDSDTGFTTVLSSATVDTRAATTTQLDVLEFAGAGKTDEGHIYIDNISLVPEPGSFALLFAGGVLIMSRRR